MQRGSRIISAVLVGMILASFLVLTPTGVAAAGAPYYVGTLADDDGTNTANCGSPTNTDCSLRSALAAATSGSDWIMFRSGLSGTITLTHGTLILEQSVMISGPGADVITVSGNNEVGVFQLGVEYFSSAPPAFSFTGFTIANGNGQLGGAMYIQMVSSVTIFKMAFTNNTARDSGGAIYNRWKGTETRFLVIKDSTFNGNASLSWWSINPDESAPGGGAIFNGAYQTLSISNSTFVDNHADGKYQAGGAILTHGPTSIVNSTITGNSSFNSGGGIRNSFGTSSSEMFTKLTNTIVAGNTVTISDQTGRDITGQYTGDNNLIGAIHQAGRLAGSNNLIGMNPALGTLGYYGGTTQTVPLLPGSPAIATGVYRDTFPQVDQRGLAREGHVDMGAFQARDFSITMIAGDQQSTTAGTDFSEPFVVSVASPHGEPVAGGLVTFSGPATGAGIQGSPLAVIGADGRAEQMLTANNAVGAYEVQANIGAAGAVSYSLENTDSTPPVTTASAKKADKSIYVSGAWTSQAVTVTLSSTDLETEVAQILYSIDGGAPQTYQNPVTISSNGAHTFTYWSIDTAGNVEASQSLSINIDTTFVLETTLLEHPPAVSSSRRVQFSFSGSGTYPIARFQCTLDVAGFETFKTCSSPFDLANVPGGVHTFQVRAVDTDGNIDATPATYTWTIDPVPPDTALLSTPPSPSDSSSASFTFSGSDNLEVAGFQCALDGADFSACASPLTLSGLGGGSHTLQVRAVDTAGTADPTPASYTWTVDIGPPETTLLTTPASISNVTSATFTFSGSDGGGIARFECSLDGAAFATCSSPVNLTGLSNGAHSFEVRAVDTSGEIDPTPARYTWTIDSVAPETTLLTQPAAITNSADASFTFSGSDASSLTFECKLDSAAFAPCSSPAQYSGLSAGAHTFQVRATDAAGNVDATPASYSWTIDTTAPETTISGAPSAVSASNAATFTFTGSDAQGVAGFECALDGAAFSACGSPLGLSGLADGAHTLRVRAIDTAGNIDATPASHTWTVDTVAPDTAINGGPPSVSGSTTASISFSGSDAIGVAGYECALDGGSYSACTSPVALSGLAEGAHTLRVRAIDTAGRVDASPAVHAWTTDLTPPDTTLLTQPPALTSSTSANVTFTGSDANGVASFECKLDNGAFTACSISTLLLGLSDGTHTFQVRAIDNAGWVDPSPASYTWTVDTTAPDTAILTNPAVVASSTSATFTFSGSDLNGVASFACSLDGGSFAPCTTPHGLSGLADGVHTFQVRATDNAGNVDATPASYTWAVDTVAPETTLLTTPPSISNNTAATLTFSGSDANGVASFECALDGGSFVPCTSPAEYNGLGEGQHTFQVRAIDNAGRVDDSPVGYTWTVDLTPPDTAFLSTPAALSSNPAPAFTFTGSDQHGVASFECALDTGAFAPCSSPHTLADLSDGSHTVLVRAFDSAGNVDPSPATYTWTVDTTAPVSGASASGNLVNGWYVNSVSVALNASDANGVARISYQIGAGDWQTYAAPLTITSNGSHTINYYAVDAAGNTEGVRSVTVQVDAVAPQVQFDPTASSPYYPLNATVVVSYSCNDPDGSGIASCTGSLPSGSTLDTGTAGTRTVTVTATDRVGKTTTQTITYQIGYQFQLQMSNTRLAPSMNSAIGGNTIVLKFSLGGNQGLNIFLAGYPKMQQINCSTRAPQGTAVALPVTGAGLQYLSNGVYQLSWVTQTSWNGTCRQVVLAFNDGSTYKLNFQFSAPRWSGD